MNLLLKFYINQHQTLNYLILWLHIILDIEVLLQSPVNKLSEQDLTTSIIVNLGKLSFQIIDGSNPQKPFMVLGRGDERNHFIFVFGLSLIELNIDIFFLRIVMY